MTAFRRLLVLLLVAPMVASAEPLPPEVVQRVASEIDRLLISDLQRLDQIPAPLVGDATFVRRAYLGIVGRIPTAREASAFLDDRSPSKREALIEALVGSPGFDSHLFNWAADLLRVQTRQERFGLGWHVWLRESLAKDMPWDELVAGMLKATGHSSADPAVGYFLRDRNMQLDNFSNTMQVFLGQQMGCAQCHDHPYDDWTQREYYQMAAFTGGMSYKSEEFESLIQRTTRGLYRQETGQEAGQGRGKQRKVARNIQQQLRPLLGRLSREGVSDPAGSHLRLPADYQYSDADPGSVVEPATLFGPELRAVPSAERKGRFAEWVTSPENPYFTKTIVNRLWQRTFGHPLLDSLDDLKVDSESAHPQVLGLLENAMQQCGYDLRQFLRILHHTRLFQRECMDDEPVVGKELAFRGMALRRMSAEQLHDSFIMLRSGGVDERPSSGLDASWQGYVEMVSAVLDAEPKQVMMLAEAANQGRERLVASRRKLDAARDQLAKAGGPAARVEAQVAVNRARQDFMAAREQANPFSMAQQMGARSDRDRNPRLRASEKPAPFEPATMVRQFGGSDRQTPSSSHTEASVPQALALLNDWKSDLMAGRQSHFSESLSALGSSESKLEWLFLSLFGERPDGEEKQRYLRHLKDPQTTRDLVTAMLNSKRFLFIQ